MRPPIDLHIQMRLVCAKVFAICFLRGQMATQKILQENDMPDQQVSREIDQADQLQLEMFGHRLRIMLDRHFDSKTDAAMLLNVAPSQVAKWLAGQIYPSARALTDFGRLGLSVEWLLNGIGDGYTQDAKGRFLATMVEKGESIIIRRQDEPLYVPVTSEEAE